MQLALRCGTSEPAALAFSSAALAFRSGSEVWYCIAELNASAAGSEVHLVLLYSTWRATIGEWPFALDLMVAGAP